MLKVRSIYVLILFIFCCSSYAAGAIKPELKQISEPRYSSNIIVAGDKGILLKSRDGIEWSIINTGLNPDFKSVAYNGTDDFMVTGQLRSGDYGSFIYMSHDQGETWQILSHFDNVDYYHYTLSNLILNSNNSVAINNDSTYEARILISRFPSPDYKQHFFWEEFGNQATLPVALHSVVYAGNNRYIAVGDEGNIFTATGDADNSQMVWTSLTSPTTKNLRQIVYNGKKFIAVGDQGVVITSSDGIAWSLKNSGFINANLYSVSYSNNVYVAVGNHGVILNSVDGNVWTKCDSQFPINAVFNSVDYNGKLFIAVGNKGLIATSEDGVNWVRREISEKVNLNKVAARLAFALTPGSLCKYYAGTRWVGPQMGGGFKLTIEELGDDPHRLYGDVKYYGGNFGFGGEGTCSDNFEDNSVTISFNFKGGDISVKAEGKSAKKLKIISGSMENQDDGRDAISGELTRV